MKLGVRAHDYGKHGPQALAGLLAREGYETVQLAIPKSLPGIGGYADITDAVIDETRAAFQGAGVEIAVFGCYQDLSAPQQEERLRAVDTVARCMAHCKRLGAQMVGTETSYARLCKLEKHRRFPLLLDSLGRLAREAQRQEVILAVEPVAWHPLEDAQTALEVLKMLDCRYIRLILDPANLLERPAEVRQGAYWQRTLSLLGPHISAVHLKDFTLDAAGRYVPCPLGEGVMDYAPLCRWLAQHPQMPVLREEMDPAAAGRDIAFMRGL